MTFFRITLSLLIVWALSNQTALADEANNLKQLSLSQAQILFHANNRELLAAQRMLQGTEADAISAGQKPNPNLSIGVSSFNLNRKEGNTNAGSNSLQDQTLNSTVQLSQLVERGDKRELRIASAKNAIKESVASPFARKFIAGSLRASNSTLV